MPSFRATPAFLFLFFWQGVLVSVGAQECQDSVASHPVCLFGGLCDCVELTSSSPCGTDITTGNGSVKVNEICAKTCDACAKHCEDALEKHPLCLFAQLCACAVDDVPTFQCGGTVASPQGDVLVNYVCAQSCDACDSNDETAGALTFQGPVSGIMPMGIVGGKTTQLEYTVKEESIDFKMTFPDVLVWASFQYWSGDFKALTDGRLPFATSGYECIVKVPEEGSGFTAESAFCRGRKLSHFITNFADLPQVPDMFTPQSVSACTSERALQEVDGRPYCTFDEANSTMTSLIVNIPSTLLMVTDALEYEDADIENIQIDYDQENGNFVASWTRSRSYPFSLSDGARLDSRWATSPRGASTWFASGMQYHGQTLPQIWQRGTDYIYLDPQAHEEYDSEYQKATNVNKAGYDDEEEFALRCEIFNVVEDNKPSASTHSTISGFTNFFVLLCLMLNAVN